MPEHASLATVDIVMATKDSARFLPQAIASIEQQTFTSHRLIVVDGDSRDDSVAIARRHPGTMIVRQGGRGFLNAWNEGIRAAGASWIAFLDSDDLWTPNRLSLQMALVARQPNVEYVYGKMDFLVEEGVRPNGFQKDVLARTHLIPTTGTALIRRSAIDRMGLFDEQSRIAGDIEWFANLREQCVVGTVDEVLLHKRIHDTSLGQITSRALFERELMTVLKRRVDARRGARGG